MKTLMLIICLVLIGCSNSGNKESDYAPLFNQHTQSTLKQRGVAMENLYIMKSDLNDKKGFLSDVQKKIINNPNVKDAKSVISTIKSSFDGYKVAGYFYLLVVNNGEVIDRTRAIITSHAKLITGFVAWCYESLTGLFLFTWDSDNILPGLAILFSIGSTIMIYINWGLIPTLIYGIFQFGLLAIGINMKIKGDDSGAVLLFLSIIISVIAKTR